ncbi:MAG: 3-methyl-2-oxobutanoate hydroxymethyltransferase [Rhodopirellula sp.]|nr:3-methyl-2-oxobutanoate hydroxymethyltransferase [Rhodopirellula sp.]
MTQTRSMTIPRFVAAKGGDRKLTMLTAYEYSWAEMFDESGVDSILVGDSLGMVVQGRNSTMPVTLDQIIYHAEIVCRAVKRALVIVDLPFMTYEVSPEQAVASAGRILKETGAAAVKIEGSANQARTIQALADADIPVMAHVGMRPQSVNKLGGHGRIQRDASQIIADGQAAEQAGAFSVLVELVPQQLAAELTSALTVPTIGIGAGPHCDGQVLVSYDMLGITSSDFSPRFLKRYADLRSTAMSAARCYIEEVRTGAFPDEGHSHS